MAQCSITGCTGDTIAREWCGKHYARWKRHGDPTTKFQAGRTKGCNNDHAKTGNRINQQSRRLTGGVLRNGYICHCVNGRYVREHDIIAESALGKPLPPKVVVHHVNEDKRDNARTNLVICPSRAYHALIHARMRALAACGHADWQRCVFCSRYEEPGVMVRRGATNGYTHANCRNTYAREHRARSAL